MKIVTIQLADKLEEYTIPAGNAIYIAGEVGQKTGRIDRAIGEICHNQNCEEVIKAGELIYSKATAHMHRSYYHFQCAKDLNLIW